MVEETADARPTAHMGPAHQCGWPPKSQVTIVIKGGSPPSSPDREALTLMVILLPARPQAIGIIAGATGGVGRRSGWLLRDWTCRFLSRLTQVQK